MNIWTDPHAWHWLGRAFAGNFVRVGVYYLMAALLLWLLVHQWLHQRLAHRVIAGWPTSADVRREMAYSFSTLLIFSAQGLQEHKARGLICRKAFIRRRYQIGERWRLYFGRHHPNGRQLLLFL